MQAQAIEDTYLPYTCSACGKDCDATMQDHGIGTYEFWGARYRDVRIELTSECCGTTAYEK